MIILDRLLEYLRTAPMFGLGQKFVDDRSKLLVAEQLAATGEFNRALNIAKNLSISLHSPVPFWLSPWRYWQIRPLIARLDRQIPYWRKVIQDYYFAFRSAQKMAATSDFTGAESMLDRALKTYPHPQAIALLTEVRRVRQIQEWFRLALSAELTGSSETARHHYHQIDRECPDLHETCNRRLAALAIIERNWTAAIEYTHNFTHPLTLPLNQLAHHQQQQHQQLQQLRHIHHQLQAQNIEAAWQSSYNYIEQLGADQTIDRLLTEYIHPQLPDIPPAWTDRCQIAQQRWQKVGSKRVLHDWAIAAYYRFLAHPDRLDWLQELIPIWVTASINTNLAPTQIHQLHQLLSTIIDRYPDEQTRSQLQLQWQREIIAIQHLGTPPTAGIRIHQAFISPGFYDLLQPQIGQIQLPPKMWAIFYTPWWRSAIACLHGNPIQAMIFKPSAPPDTAATKFAQQYVAYHEGCYYLECRPGGFPRWREAFPMLELAKPQILTSPAWRSTVDRLCDIHHLSIFHPIDRQEFANCWYNLLHTNTAKAFLNFISP